MMLNILDIVTMTTKKEKRWERDDHTIVALLVGEQKICNYFSICIFSPITGARRCSVSYVTCNLSLLFNFGTKNVDFVHGEQL
jgi:hypothetical protein